MPPVSAAAQREHSPAAEEKRSGPQPEFLEARRAQSTTEAPPEEAARYRPRFRVVTRRPLAVARRTGSRLADSPWLLAILPGLCLLTYVVFWTLNLRGAYYREQLQQQIAAARIEQAELEAEKRRLQAPALVLDRAARELGMQPASRREFARLPVAQRLARNHALDGKGPGDAPQ